MDAHPKVSLSTWLARLPPSVRLPNGLCFFKCLPLSPSTWTCLSLAVPTLPLHGIGPSSWAPRWQKLSISTSSNHQERELCPAHLSHQIRALFREGICYPWGRYWPQVQSEEGSQTCDAPSRRSGKVFLGWNDGRATLWLACWPHSMVPPLLPFELLDGLCRPWICGAHSWWTLRPAVRNPKACWGTVCGHQGLICLWEQGHSSKIFFLIKCTHSFS